MGEQEQKLAVCPGCGRRYTDIGQLSSIYQLGASLQGLCSCGCSLWIGRLWKFTRRETLASKDQAKIEQMPLFGRF